MANDNRTSSTPAAAAAHKSLAVTAKESLESIVVAFALAFIFRAFIVEAFVIPTGSMAPTLYGQQVTHTCSTCGYEYAHGIEQLPPSGRVLDLTLECPNCGSVADHIPAAEVLHPSSGDRILVHKWPLSIGGPMGPKRWDVTVFKDPANGTVNFIKRMVGKPGEVLEIIDGDVYAVPLEVLQQKDPGVIAEMDQLRRDLYAYAHNTKYMTLDQARARYAAVNKRLVPYLEIQRKAVDAPDAQSSLWFNVFNQDFLPDYSHTISQPDWRVGWSALLDSVDGMAADELGDGRIPANLRRALESLTPAVTLAENPALVVEEPGKRWRVGSSIGDLLIVRDENRVAVYEAAAAAAWNTSKRTITFKSDSDRPLGIQFSGKPIDDFYAYGYMHNSQNPSQFRVPVGDLRLAFTWFPDAGNGGLRLEMNRDRDLFAAELAVDGAVRVEHLADGAKKAAEIGKQKLDVFAPGKAVQVEFINVDYRVSLRIDGREVIASTDQQYAPNLPALLARNPEDPSQVTPSSVRILAHKLQCRLDHVELDRDEYYRSSIMIEPASYAQPGMPMTDSVPNPFHNWPGWGTQGWPIMLRNNAEAHEYFMMGDNSPGSKDSRLWWEIGPHLQYLGEQYQVGTVPEDQLIGRAFFVYWPSGYRRSWTADIGIIPNFGRMRWIR